MPRAEASRVLAIALDAAQGPFVRELAKRGELPGIAALLERGSWSTVTGPAYIGSGAVWPTFATGSEPWEHGYPSEWYWDPLKMRIERIATKPIDPFWRELDGRGLKVGAVDIPFLQPARLARGFEIAEWGSHEKALGRTETWPPELREELGRDPGPHPLASEAPLDADGVPAARLERVAQQMREGIRRRGRLAARLLREEEPDMLLVVFSEVHHCGHLLWHTVEPDHPVYAGKQIPATATSLTDLYRDVDEQVAALAGAAGESTRIVVFAMHGMQASFGMPDFTDEVLEHHGLGRRASWRSGPPGQRARRAFGAAKRRAPAPARRLYNRLAPLELNRAVAGPTLVAPWEWRHTRVFSMNSDQHGWLRLNLRGREREGIVPESAFEETARETEELFGSLRDDDGTPLVDDVVRIHELAGGPHPTMPDLSVHWSQAAFRQPVRIAGTSIEKNPVARRLTGRHDFDGFCLSVGDGDLPEEVRGVELHRLLTPGGGR